MELGSLLALAVYFILMLGIGLYSYQQANQGGEGYLLGGRQLSPQVTALSAGASDMSGWMLMGLPGAIFVSGLSASWIAIGLCIGALLNYILLAPRLRAFSEAANNAITIPDYIANRFNDHSNQLRWLASFVIIVFFTLYTASGLVAGGKLFESAFGWSYQAGLLLTAGVVVAYTMLGGFKAVSLTDFVQGCIMLIALLLVPAVLYWQFNTPLDLLSQRLDIRFDAASQQTVTGLGIISLMAWGLGYFGQPHIIVRFMAIRSVSDLSAARNIGMLWMILSLIGTVSNWAAWLCLYYSQSNRLYGS